MEDSQERKSVLKLITKDWKRYIVIISPFALIWLPIMSNTSEARCAYVIMLMSIFYMTEALPLAVTALIPVFAFPLFGITSTDEICRVYMRGTVMMFFGGLAVAIAVEHCNLHKRIALFIILKVGQTPRKLMVSFMITSMFLSMWISNTAAAAMMIPILDAILQEIYKNHTVNKKMKTTAAMEMCNTPNLQRQRDFDKKSIHSKTSEDVSLEEGQIARTNSEERLLPPDKESEDLSKMYFLATAYGANMGGIGFPTGTSPNLVFWGILQSSFPSGTGLDFATWMAFNIPGMILCIIAAWISLEMLFMGCWGCRKRRESSKEQEEAIRNLVQEHYNGLGRITFHEICVTILFFLLVCLWVFRAPEFINGWADLVEGSFHNHIRVDNATPAILVLFLLFVVPSRLPWQGQADEPTPACLTWEAVHTKVPWGLALLMGGGFAMAEGSTASGLSDWIKDQLQGLEILPAQVIVFLVCVISAFLTEIVSNATAASILIPVVKDMAIAIGMHPLYLMLPTAISCSYALMLPVSNPPNAIAFNASTLKTSDMIKAGLILKLICIVIMTLQINTLGIAIFDLNTFPSWAAQSAPPKVQLLNNATVVSY